MSEENKNNDEMLSENQKQVQDNPAPTSDLAPKTESAAKKRQLYMIFILAIIVVGVAIGVFAYFNSPDQRVKRALASAQRYMEELNFPEAVSSLRTLLEIDPQNPEIVVTVTEHMNRILTAADEKHRERAYEEEFTIASSVYEFDFLEALPAETKERAEKTNKRAKGYKKVGEKMDKANEDFEKGDYEKAKDEYEELIDEDGVSEDAADMLELIEIHSDFIELFLNSDWEKIAKYIDSEDFEVVFRLLDVENPMLLIGEPRILIEKKDESLYVAFGVSDDGKIKGHSIAVVSAVNTYAVYEGDWNNGKPNGAGTISIWDKKESFGDAAIMKGNLSGGIMDGAVIYSDKEDKGIPITTDKGKVEVLEIRENGHIIVARDHEKNYRVEDASASDKYIDKFEMGLPGFGGSDKKLSIKEIDTVPPKMACYFEVEQWYEKEEVFNIGLNETYDNYVTAIDNVDGDITKLMYVMERSCPDTNGVFIAEAYSSHITEGGALAIYISKDSDENQSMVVVRFDIQMGYDCGESFTNYKCISFEIIEGSDKVRYEEKDGELVIKIKKLEFPISHALIVYDEPDFIAATEHSRQERGSRHYHYSAIVNGFYQIDDYENGKPGYVWHDFCEKIETDNSETN